MSHRFEPGVAKLADKDFQRNTILQRDGGRCSKAIHQTADGASFFGHRNEDLARPSIRVQANADVPLVTADAEFVSYRIASIGQPFPTWLVDDLLDDSGRRCIFGLLGFALGRQRLALLGSVAINGDGFQTKFPAPEVRLSDIIHRAVGWHVDRLADSSRQKGLSGRHHLDVRLPANASRSVGRCECTIKNR